MDARNITNDFMKTTFSARMDSSPSAERLRPGTFTNNEDVYAEAALLSRAARPSANTERCSGSPGSIYPYHSEVLSDDLLSRTCLFTVSEDDDSFTRSPLQVQSSRAEKKVAQDFRGAAPRDIDNIFPCPQTTIPNA